MLDVKRKKILLGMMICILVLCPSVIQAHPGNTDASGCHVCRTNCEKWGLKTGEYHCHGTNNSTQNHANTNINTNSQNTTTNGGQSNMVPKTPQLSSDTSLSKIIVEDQEILVNDVMSHTTKEDQVIIQAFPTDNKASVQYEEIVSLSLGLNEVHLVVTAENGTTKDYTLNITREEILSDNTDVKIWIDGKEVIFTNGKSSTIYLSDQDKVDIRYELADQKSKIKITGNDKIPSGRSSILVEVTAENGKMQTYEIIVERMDTATSVISVILMFAIVLGGLWIYDHFKHKGKYWQQVKDMVRQAFVRKR